MDIPNNEKKEIKHQHGETQNDSKKNPSKFKIFSNNFSKFFDGIKSDSFRSVESLKSSMGTIIKNEIWEIPNFLSPKECESLIKATEILGYQDVTKMANSENGSVLRDMKRLFLSDSQTAEILTKKIEPFLPRAFEGGLFKGVNEKFKFYKYEKNNKYDRHIDGEYNDEIKQIKSVASFIIYLNAPSKGGMTRFHSHKFENGIYDIKPEIGKLLIYRQK